MKEDRLLLTAEASDGTQARLWLTRRFVRLMWQALSKILESQPAVQAQAASETRQAILSMQHQAVAESKAITETRENVESKLAEGPSPLLAIGMRYNAVSDTIVRITFQTENGQDISVALNGTLVHSVRHLLSRCASAAEWDLDMDVGDGVAEPPDGSELH